MQGRVFIDGNIVGVVGLCAVRATYIALLVVLSTAVVLTAINYYPAHVNRHLLKWSFRQRLCETAPRKNSLLDLHCIAIQIDLLILFQHFDGLFGEQLLMLEYLIWVEDLERVRTTSVGLARASICSWSLICVQISLFRINFGVLCAHDADYFCCDLLVHLEWFNRVFTHWNCRFYAAFVG